MAEVAVLNFAMVPWMVCQKLQAEGRLVSPGLKNCTLERVSAMPIGQLPDGSQHSVD